jgi:AcrR family transcriptional regulator
MTDVIPAVRAGRPRDEACDRAIAAAALELLIEDGFEKMSIEGIAARAGVGKSTVYRRWDNKADLVVSAFLGQCKEHVVDPDTGSLVGDLRILFGALMNKFGRDGAVMQAFLSGQQRYPELGLTFRSAFLDDRRAAVRAVLARAIDRGELPPDADLEILGDLGSAILWHRISVAGVPLEPDLPERIIEQIFVPIMRGARRS